MLSYLKSMRERGLFTRVQIKMKQIIQMIFENFEMKWKNKTKKKARVTINTLIEKRKEKLNISSHNYSHYRFLR